MTDDSNRQRLKDFEGRLADGWRWVRLGDHVTKVGSGITPLGGEAVYVRSGTPLIRSQNIHPNRFVFDGLVYITAAQDAEMEGSRVCPGDVLLNITGASIGRVCVVPSDICPANVNQHVSIVRCTPDLYPPFLSYYISTPGFQRFIMDTQAGATRQALTKTLIEDFQIPLPPLPEQERIAAILNQRMAAVERARAAAEARSQAAKGLPAAYLRGLFNSAAAGSWPRRKLGEVCQLLPSKSIATDSNTEVQAITTACLTETGFAAAGVKSARMWAGDASESAVSPGEVLVARSNTPDLVGRAAMYSGEPSGVIATDLTIRIWPSRDVTSQFLALYLSFLYLTGYWKARAGGASGSMKKITREQIQGEEIPVPPFGEQERVARLLNGQLADSEQIRKTIEEECGAINALPAALLRRAFSGVCDMNVGEI